MTKTPTTDTIMGGRNILPTMKFGEDASDTMDWLDDFARSSRILFHANGLIIKIIEATIKMEPAEYELSPPIVETDKTKPLWSADMILAVNKERAKIFANELSTIGEAQRTLYAAIISTITVGSGSDMVLKADSSWVINDQQSSPSLRKAMLRIISTHITSRNGELANRPHQLIAKQKTEMEIDQLRFVNSDSIDQFQAKWDAAMRRRLQAKCSDLTGGTLVVKYINAISEHLIYGKVASIYRNEFCAWPVDVLTIYQKMKRFEVEPSNIPRGYKITGAERHQQHVLAATLKYVGADKPDATAAPKKEERKAGLQPNGTSFYPKDQWEKMTQSEREVITLKNRAIRAAKRTAGQDTKKDNVVATTRAHARGEFDDDDDFIIEDTTQYGVFAARRGIRDERDYDNTPARSQGLHTPHPKFLHMEPYNSTDDEETTLSDDNKGYTHHQNSSARRRKTHDIDIIPPPLTTEDAWRGVTGWMFEWQWKALALLMMFIVTFVVPSTATHVGTGCKAHGHSTMQVLATHNHEKAHDFHFDPFHKDYFGYDTMADLHVCKNASYIQDMKSCRTQTIGGINPDDMNTMSFNLHGRVLHQNMKRVAFCPSAAANIISAGDAHDQGFRRTEVPHEDAFDLYHPEGGPIMRFGRVDLGHGRRSKMYLMDGRTMSTPVLMSLKVLAVESGPPSSIRTIEQNKQRYTKREVANADKALRYLDCIGHQPLPTAIETLRRCRNAPVTEQDLRNCHDIYGKRISSCKANSVHRTTGPARNDVERPPDVPVHLDTEIDIMFVKKRAFLIMIALNLDFSIVTPIQDRSGPTLAKAIPTMVAKFRSRNFLIQTIRCDNEKGVIDTETTISINTLGVELHNCAPGQHCPHVERRIRWVKEKFRRHEHRLPFAMCNTLVDFCVITANRETNLQRTSSSTVPLSPSEKFSGRPYDFKLDGRVPFGTYLQATVRNTDNTASARTQGCIALLPRGNLTGSMYVYHIATGAILVRDHFTETPYSDMLLERLDQLAADDGLYMYSDPFEALEYGVPTNDTTVPDPTLVTQFQPYNHNNSAYDTAIPAATEPPNVPLQLGGDTAVTQPNHVLNNDSEPEAAPQAEPGAAPQAEPRAAPKTSMTTSPHVRRGGRSRHQSNSLADLSSHQHALLTGSHFTDAVFESKFNAQLEATQHWHDRHFAFVISWQRAIKNYGEPAAEAIKKELQQMIDKKVWHPRSLAGLTKKERKNAIRAKMFVKEKFFPSGGFDKIKARLVARGDQQDRTMYTDDDTSSPTVEQTSVMSVAAIAACESRYVATCDIGGAFLNADMFKESGKKVIIRLDKSMAQMLSKVQPHYLEYVDSDGTLYVELDKAMYGCIESAKLWFEKLKDTLVRVMGFSQNLYDGCTFNKVDEQGLQITIVMHVDDLLITCANRRSLDDTLEQLSLAFPETTKHYGPCVPFLGMDFDFRVPGEVRITMPGMEADIVDTSKVLGTAVTPATEHLFTLQDESVPVDSSEEQDWFRSYVARLAYVARRARPEILTAVSFLATRATKADEEDMGKLRRVIRYLRKTAGRGICLKPGALGISVRAYVDAAYGVHADGKSHTGTSIVIGEHGPAFVRSTKQPIVAKSSTEAELIATSDSANQVFHVRNFLIHQGHDQGPATILQDNMSTMALIEKGRSTNMRTRHIQIRYFWVKERVDNGEAEICYMKSESMGPANALTKPLTGMQFSEERQQLTNWD
jgi:hypothetical protein